MVEKRFEKLGMPDIERFENYLPTAFNSELTLLQKVNKIIFDLIETNKLTNEMVDYLNKFIETFDEKLYETIDDILSKWLEDGILTKLIRNTINEEVIEARTDYLGKKYVDLKERLDSEKAESLLKAKEIEVDIVEVTTQLAQKVTQGVGAVKNADLSQEVKESMTGGSVAVVGNNAVLTQNIVDKNVTYEKLQDNFNYAGVINGGEDLDIKTTTGTYITVGGTINKPGGTHSTALLHVMSNDSGTYSTQIYQDINGEIATRFKSLNNNGFTEWRNFFHDPLSIKHMNVVNFGDSIFGNWDTPNDVSTTIANMTGATVYNVGFGGCRMGAHYEHWDAFSMYRLADAITTGDWSLQDQALIDSANAPTVDKLPDYFASHLKRLKAINFNSISAITIGYGTNDWFNEDLGLDSETNPTEVWTYKGALRYTLEKIMTTFKHIKILIVPPIYRNLNDGTDGDTFAKRGLFLYDIVNGAIDVAKEYHVQYTNGYYEMGFNKLNYTMFYDDGTHLNSPGRTRYGEYLAKALYKL